MLGFLKPDVEKLARQDDVAGLIRALRDRSDPKRRGMAAAGLKKILERRTAPEARAPLIEALDDPYEPTRAFAARALAHLPSPEATAALIRLIDADGASSRAPGSQDPGVIQAAVEGLGGNADPAATKALLALVPRLPSVAPGRLASLLGDPVIDRDRLAMTAAIALRRLGDEAGVERSFDILQWMEGQAASPKAGTQRAGYMPNFLASVRAEEAKDMAA